MQRLAATYVNARVSRLISITPQLPLGARFGASS